MTEFAGVLLYERMCEREGERVCGRECEKVREGMTGA